MLQNKTQYMNGSLVFLYMYYVISVTNTFKIALE